MSKGPDLSAFPIPRKGSARPLSNDEPIEAVPLNAAPERGDAASPTLPPTSSMVATAALSDGLSEARDVKTRRQVPPALHPTAPILSGQIVATTVKLDEDRYLRLVDAGKPSPGRLKRRTIQEIMVEALDEWFAHRGL